ncbi:hypothetical protein GOP47_0016823 [Adiantum capillus-veneris]|uniref:Uncharacterized protein n=1 Tax=Adiantum capillus-veneris TaxID=13818 RepID=A0A9D4UJB3_ADICA|nr:hypothetical protein GOP47_0016823 [Adiantum capillus-veneris]
MLRRERSKEGPRAASSIPNINLAATGPDSGKNSQLLPQDKIQQHVIKRPPLRKRPLSPHSRQELLQQKRREAREAMDAVQQTVFFDDVHSTMQDFWDLIKICQPSTTSDHVLSAGSSPLGSTGSSCVILSSSCAMSTAASSSNVAYLAHHPFFTSS